MRDVDGINEFIEKIRPFLPEIEQNFEDENAKFKDLLSRDHDLIGRVLKCHLILEYYLDRFLWEQLGPECVKNANLRFYQKAHLLPSHTPAAVLLRPAILKVNAIRNRFGHTLDPTLDLSELEPLSLVLSIARAGIQFAEPVDAIEAFTTVACTWLMVHPEHLKQAWSEALSHWINRP